ncbi:EXS-domain-containing protein [Gigaspora margarita]|uniref:EXS-domain-containing protein n=1 Tax=Gigaspora margarita TaxID=4874 RepID=A0A8H4EPU6_GIGMA|nr:EXS-domain-containing protein [Gigaspora margarita]
MLFYDLLKLVSDIQRPWPNGNSVLFRFKQCIAVYLHSKDPKNTGREHLFNALKYCSALPVILFSALQKWYKTDEVAISEYWITPSNIFNLW